MCAANIREARKGVTKSMQAIGFGDLCILREGGQAYCKLEQTRGSVKGLRRPTR
jgi:hypothetical protein